MTTTIMLHPTTCPHCGALHARPHDEIPPRPGDASLCYVCGGWCVFDDKLELGKPDADSIAAIAIDPECRELRAAWLAFNTDRKTG